MTETRGPAADPLAYDSGDSVGLCLDVDGTVYRSGSVFIETLAFLPYAEGIELTPAERRHRRTALSAVAEYRGGSTGRAKWQGVLAGLDALQVAGHPRLSERLLAALARRRADGRPRRDVSTPARRERSASSDRYRRMRETVLTAYGRLLRGRRRAAVTTAVADVVGRRCGVEPRLGATLDRLARRTDVDLYLITDMPEHVASAYADAVSDASRVVGVTYDVDDADRYTGRFDRVDKGATVSRLRAERGWDYVLAAGDSPVDVPMAREAAVFLAVAGQSDLGRRAGPSDAVSPCDSAAALRTRLAPGRNVVRVPRDEAFEAVLRTTLDAAGLTAE